MKSASILVLAVLAAVPALAQNDMSWVSHSGNDGNPCTLAQPCRTFAQAYTVTNNNGIIKARDAGEYGPVVISKPITIDGNGVGASIEAAVSPGAGVIVAVGTAGPVEIRNLAIHANCGCDGIAAGSYGMASNLALIIENVSINSGNVGYGVRVISGTTAIRGVTVTGSACNGIDIEDGNATISDSVVRNSSCSGIAVYSPHSASKVLIERSRMVANPGTAGLFVDGQHGATVWISDCVITGNATGVQVQDGGQLITLRNNTWADNTTDGSTPFSVSLK
jgi:hypothetical protein